MKFSVLLSVYYKESAIFLEQCFDSILCQTLQPNEIILVKDGPLTEELETVIKEYASKFSMLKTIPLLKNQGLGKALNEGLKHCTHDLVARMDTDDICKPQRFEKQINIFKYHSEIDVVGSWVDEFTNKPDNLLSTRKLPERHEEIYVYGQKRNPINHPTVMFRKSKVLSSRFEGLPLVLLEAMSCGLPIVSFDCPEGPKSLIGNGAGILVKPESPQDLANALQKLINSYSLRETLSLRSHERSKKYSKASVIALWDNLFHDLLINS